ncbi:MAG: hypothetical protein A4E42_01085 [Methanoregulaceae archaeon PtaU1.Bin222]|nr:MAG: hypothetical protein A4E42_01085 [Methanoregulaceae archaeon PtaU1.Bin222]
MVTWSPGMTWPGERKTDAGETPWTSTSTASTVKAMQERVIGTMEFSPPWFVRITSSGLLIRNSVPAGSFQVSSIPHVKPFNLLCPGLSDSIYFMRVRLKKL